MREEVFGASKLRCKCGENNKLMESEPGFSSSRVQWFGLLDIEKLNK